MTISQATLLLLSAVIHVMNIAHEINAGYDRNNDKSNTNVLISRAQVTLADIILFSCTQKLLFDLSHLWSLRVPD